MGGENRGFTRIHHEFRWAPSSWSLCANVLFYTVSIRGATLHAWFWKLPSQLQLRNSSLNFYRMARYIEFFFEILSSLTYHRLNKTTSSFIPFRLFFSLSCKHLRYRGSKLEPGAISGNPTPPGRLTNLCIKIVHLETIFSNSKWKISFLQAQISLGNSLCNGCCFRDKDVYRGGENYKFIEN